MGLVLNIADLHAAANIHSPESYERFDKHFLSKIQPRALVLQNSQKICIFISVDVSTNLTQTAFSSSEFFDTDFNCFVARSPYLFRIRTHPDFHHQK